MIFQGINVSGSMNVTGSFVVPKGTANPATASSKQGDLFFNTELDSLVVFTTGGSWTPVGDVTASAAGPASAEIEYLLVAGGGGGGGRHAGGGGAGGYLSSSLASVQPGSSFTITVGSGGSGGPDGSTAGKKQGTSGTNSTIAGTTITTITAITGGGGGGDADDNTPPDGLEGLDGGSGGGASYQLSGGSGTAGQGFAGGDGQGSPNYSGGGGGGASAVGGNASGTNAGGGGSGLSSTITGTSVTRAGGGGAGGWSGVGSGAGGNGGGGTGVGNAGSSNAGAGTVNTGGGGGGGGGNSSAGGSGGSGVAIFAYETGSASGLGGIKSLNGGRMVHTFNTSGTLTIAGAGEYPVAPLDVFTPVIYTGNNSTQAITTGFQPDLVWIKARTDARSHNLIDSVRGAGKFIFSTSTGGESTLSTFNSFDSNGFTVSGTDNYINNSSHNYVAWCFKAGGLSNKSADFNGSSSYVTLPSNPISGTGDYSVSVWAKCDDLSAGQTGQQYITQFGSIASTGGGTVIAKWVNNSGTVNKIYIHVGGGYVSTSHVVVEGAWTHYTVTQTGTSILFYVNGSLHDTLTAPYSPNRTSGNSSIGYYNNGSHSNFSGNIQQVRVFNSVLTSSEVTELYNETKADNNVLNYPAGAGCVAAYPLGENVNGVDGLYNGSSSNVTFGKPGYLTRNTEGTIESTVSANQDAGFSIVKYTGNGTNGATVGHGLSSAPELIITKGLSTAYNWNVVTSLLQNGYLELNTTSTLNSNSSRYITAGATTNNLTDYVQFNQNNIEHIAYCFHSVPGYQKIGSYTGKGNSATNTISFGFAPRFVMIKRTDSTGGWRMFDNVRSTGSYPIRINHSIRANLTTAEYDGSPDPIGYGSFTNDGLSFSTSEVNGDINANGGTYIYLAIG